MRGEEGVALVVTLALFMFLYVSAAGVFAIGRAVKDKVALQNAVDAAAYSAAIVEADTLSKIATINRAMAWTYVSMIRHHMDYVTWKWLNRTVNQYKADEEGAELIGALAPAYAPGDPDRDVKLKNGQTPKILALAASDQKGAEIIGKIIADRNSIAAMAQECDLLIAELKTRVPTVVADILEANLPPNLGDWCYYNVNMENPAAWTNSLQNVIANKQQIEDLFLKFAEDGIDVNAIEKPFHTFNPYWFPNVQGTISRRFEYQNQDAQLKSSWYYKKGLVVLPDQVVLDDKESDDYYTSSEPSPLVLKPDYFNDSQKIARGAITVAVAMQARNPWEEFVVRSGDSAGFYDVFNPAKATKWVYAIASAQAGYRPLGAEKSNQPPQYSLNYVEGENLRTDDWDAVFVPVSRAFTGVRFAQFMSGAVGAWTNASKQPAADLDPYALSVNEALPGMHNDLNSLSQLNWSGLLNKMYH